MKIVNSSKTLVRLVAADKLRQRGFEVYSLPVAPMRYLPDLVAYRNERFYNIYLFESPEEREIEFSDKAREYAFEYAEIMGAVVTSMFIKLVVSKSPYQRT